MHIINISSSGDYMVYILLMQVVANETYVSNRCPLFQGNKHIGFASAAVIILLSQLRRQLFCRSKRLQMLPSQCNCCCYCCCCCCPCCCCPFCCCCCCCSCCCCCCCCCRQSHGPMAIDSIELQQQRIIRSITNRDKSAG